MPNDITFDIEDGPLNITAEIQTAQTLWGTILGTLSTQTDLWSGLSAAALNSDLINVSNALSGITNLINSNSANWDESDQILALSAAILPTVINYLSSETIIFDTVDARNQILSSGIDLFDIFLTEETDNQTLTYEGSSFELSITNGNTVNLSSILESPQSNAIFNSVTGTFYGDGSNLVGVILPEQIAVNTSVQQNSAFWNIAYNTATAYSDISSTFITNTEVQIISSLLTPLSLTNTLTSSLITNIEFANFQTNVANASATLLPISIFQELSSNWESTYTNVQSNSANWDYQGTDLKALSSNWESTYTNVQSNSSNWQDTYTNVQSNSSNWDYQGLDLKALSGNWESTYTNVQSNSANWDYQGLDLKALSGNWESTYTNVQSNSANWDYQGTDLKALSGNWESTYTNVQSNSSNWDYQGLDLKALSGNWQDTYTNVQSNSANWDYQGTDLKALSSNWESTYTNVQSNSSNWQDTYTNVQSNSANWDTAYSISTEYQNSSGSFAPLFHASNHFINGQDPILPSDIGAGWALTFPSSVILLDNNTTLSAGRNIQQRVDSYSEMDFFVTLPVVGIQTGDNITIVANSFSTGSIIIRRRNWSGSGFGPEFSNLITTTGTDKKYTFRLSSPTSASWNFIPVDFHTHVAKDITDLGTAALMPSGTFVQKGPVISSDLTVVGPALLGKTTTGNGNIEQITLSSPLTFLENSLQLLPNVFAPYNTFTTVENSSGNWQDTYTTVQTTSSTFATNSYVNSTFIPLSSKDKQLSLSSTNVVENSAIAVEINSINNSLFNLSPPPTYILPVATLTNFSPSTNVEVGTNINNNLSLGFTQNDAGSATNFNLSKNNVTVAASAIPFIFNVNEIATLGTTTYRNTVTYTDGVIKNNPLLGIPDDRGRVLAGSVFTNSSYTGFYIRFYGSVATLPGNIRNLPLSAFDTNSTTFSFNVNQVTIAIAIPNSKSIQSIITGSFENITTNFTLSSINISDASNTPVSYKLYTYTTSLPLNTTVTVTVTTP